ncbi:protein FAM166C-like [Anthonomus grandis grandis]|uniref:protein FAM166C-like n=1 Tax=Anthonomus grandis grandis TaxID=2921223 RepID=UPI00216542BA|nr:protein FAM166C-like [Anthonomus grandis grandis]
MGDVRFSDISASYYPPSLKMGFIGAHPPLKSEGYDPGRVSYFQNFRNENISKMQMPPQEWGVITSPYTPHPDISIFKKPCKYNRFPLSEISMLDKARQQEVDDFYMACQLHRDQYKDHTGSLHPLDYFKTSEVTYQCPKDPSSVYFKYPEFYTKYKDPLVMPLTLERSYRAPILPERALTGVYNRTSFIGRK